MSDKKQAECIKLKSKAFINCPYCGGSNRVNDLLFRTSWELSAAEDNRLADYYYRFYKKMPDEGVFHAHWTRARRLISWAELPSKQIKAENGFVTEVRDSDGEWISERACIWCHNKISEDWVNRRGKEISVYAQPGAEAAAAEFIEQLIDADKEARDMLEDLACFIAGRYIVFDCTDEERYGEERRKQAKLNGMSCEAGIFFLLTEPVDTSGEAADMETIKWLRTGVSKAYGTAMSNKPTVAVLIPPAGASGVNLKETHRILYARLGMHFSNLRIYSWSSAGQLVQDLTSQPDWMSGS